MATITTWFTLGTLGMALGTAVLAYGSRFVPESNRRRYAVVVSIPGIAVVAYLVMALGVGAVRTNGAVVYVPRYVDWLLTTPLNVLFLGLLAGVDRETLTRLVGLQVLTIAFGLAGAVVGGIGGYLAFLAGSAAFAGVVWLLYRDVAASAAGSLGEIEYGIYRTLRNFVVVLWLVYPVIWLLASTGIGLMDVETTTLVVTYLDVVTKVGFGLIALHGELLGRGLDAEVAAGAVADEAAAVSADD